MNDAQKRSIGNMRVAGQTYSQIAETLGISVNTIKSYCQRAGLTERKIPYNDQLGEQKDTCKHCGADLRQRPNMKPKTFCSDECRIRWWSKHRNQSGGAATVEKHCEYCGCAFTSQISAKRKYCRHACFIAHGREEDHYVAGTI